MLRFKSNSDAFSIDRELWKEELFKKMSELLKKFNIDSKVKNLQRCVIKEDGTIHSIDFDKGFHSQLPEGIATGFIIVLTNGRKVLYLREQCYILDQFGIEEIIENQIFKVITDGDINNLPDYERQEFLKIMSDVVKLEQQISNLLKRELGKI
jgi:predicted Ser/Thr protein kinase